MKLFSSDRYTKPGKGVDKNEPKKPAVIRFFITLWNKKYKLMGINALYVLCNLFAVAFVPCLFAGCVGIYSAFCGNAINYTVYLKTMLFFTVLFTSIPVFTTGPSQAGLTFVLKSFVKEEPCFVWHDFKTKAKSNFGIALKTSLINGAVGTILALNTTAYMIIANPENPVYSGALPAPVLFLFAATIFFIAFLLIMMSMYQYHMIVTFNITLKQLYRNSFILVLVKWLPSLLIFVLHCLLIGVPIFFIPDVSYMSYVIVLILYVILYPGVVGLINNFFVYPTIKKYMIDNASADKSADSEQASAETPEQAGANDVGGNVNAGGRFENGRWISDDE